MCRKKAPCPAVVDGYRPMTAQRGPSRSKVREMNKADKGNRKFVLVQIPEATEAKSIAHKNGFKKISKFPRLENFIRWQSQINETAAIVSDTN